MTPPLAPAVPAVRRTSPLVVLLHTITFRQARQLVPVLIPPLAAGGIGGSVTTVVVLAVLVTLVSLAAAALSWWRFSYTDGPSAVVVTRGVLQQMFGLATVAVLTASSQGTVRIWHLEHGMAQRVADDLARRAELVRDQAT